MYRAILLFASLSLLLLAAAPMLALHVFYQRYGEIEKLAQASERFDKDAANAIKHATAAADVFTLLRPVMGDTAAEETVIRLGVLNEYIERVLYYDDTDSAREMMKDLHNNYTGIVAARLVEEGEDPFRIIVSFAHNSTLIVDGDYNPFLDERSQRVESVELSYDWFREHHGEISRRIQKKIMRAKDLRHLGPIELSGIAGKFPTVQ